MTRRQLARKARLSVLTLAAVLCLMGATEAGTAGDTLAAVWAVVAMIWCVVLVIWEVWLQRARDLAARAVQRFGDAVSTLTETQDLLDEYQRMLRGELDA